MRRASCLPPSPEYDSPITNNTSFSLETGQTQPNTPSPNSSESSPNSSESSIESLKPDHSPPQCDQEFEILDHPFPQSRTDVINKGKRFFTGFLPCSDKVIIDRSKQQEVMLKSMYSGVVPVTCLPSIKKNGFYRMECLTDDNRHIKIIDYRESNLNFNYIYPVQQLMNLSPIEISESEMSTSVDCLFAVIQFLNMCRDNNIPFKMKDIIVINSITNLSNAFFNGYYMQIGEGNQNLSPRSSQLLKPLCSLDIISHELTHGLIQEICDLEYQGQSGALNESIADILAVCCEFYTFQNIYLKKGLFIENSNVSWDIGMQVKMNGMRSFSNPWIHQQPKLLYDKYYYRGFDDYGGVHTNSGIPNHWFYRVCQIRPIFEVMQIVIETLKISYKKTTLREFHDLIESAHHFYIDIE